MFTENDIGATCGRQCLEESRQVGILCKKGHRSLQYFHKSGQEFCAGCFLSSHPKNLATYLENITSFKDALSVNLVLKFASRSKSAAGMIIKKLVSIFESEFQPQEYYDENLAFDDTRPIQQFIELCLECNFEADAKDRFVSILRNLFVDGNALFYGISTKVSISLAYFISFCDREGITSVTLRPIAHSSHPFIGKGPTYDMYRTHLASMKNNSTEEIHQITEQFKADHPDLHEQWQNLSSDQLAAYLPCIQASEGMPSISETDISTLFLSFRDINLRTLNISDFTLGDNFDHLIDSIKNGDMKSLLKLHAKLTASQPEQMTTLATNLPNVSQLESLDISWNKVEPGVSLPTLATNLKHCKSMRELLVNNMQASADDMLALAQVLPSTLTRLAIHRNKINDAVALCLIASLPKTLAQLAISVGNLSIGKHDELLSSIHTKLIGLQWLSIRDSPYPADLVKHGGLALRSCTRLVRLILESTCHDHDDFIPSDSLKVFLDGLQAAVKIKIVKLYGIKLDKEGFQTVRELCRLKAVQELRLVTLLLCKCILAHIYTKF